MAALDNLAQRMMGGMRMMIKGKEDEPGEQDNGSVMEMASHAVQDESDAVEDYTKMLAACKDPKIKPLIAETLADEKKHLIYMKRIAGHAR